jgi:hypothetical protein
MTEPCLPDVLGSLDLKGSGSEKGAAAPFSNKVSLGHRVIGPRWRAVSDKCSVVYLE